MELTQEQKEKMIRHRLDEYKAKIFTLEMDRSALEAIGDDNGVKNTEQHIEALRKAYEAVERMI